MCEAQHHSAAGSDEAEPLGRLWSKLDGLADRSQVFVGDRTARVLAKSTANGIYLLAEFLTNDDCDGLIALAKPHLKPSAIINDSAGGTHANYARSSQGAGLPRGANELGRRIESRVAALTGLPETHGESLQLLRYDLGGEYLPHFDFFEPDAVGGGAMIAEGGQRLASVIMYLTDVEAGGGTLFPALDLEFTPQRGTALLFPSIARDGALIRKSLHAGAPVLSGEKWIATKWLRDRALG